MDPNDKPPESDPESPAEAEAPAPRRRAPEFYAGETFGRQKAKTPSGRTVRVPRSVQYPDVERHANGAVPSKRNKLMRRMIRKALKKRFSKVEQARKLPQAMLEQARVIAEENGRGSRFARRLYEKELAIHQPVFVPERAEDRRDNRDEQKDAIAQLVEAQEKK